METNNSFYFITEEGILIISKIGYDYPFVIMCDSSMGFVYLLSDQVNDSLRSHVEIARLDITSMKLYAGEFILRGNEVKGWVITIPFNNCTIDPGRYFEFIGLHPHYTFGPNDFPQGFGIIPRLAKVVGFPE